MNQPIEIEIWEPNPDKPGYLRKNRVKTTREVYNELYAILNAEELIDEYFNLDIEIRYNKSAVEPEFPPYKWIACYAVTGGSEGHYIHIDCINRGDSPDSKPTATNVFLGKTFQGMEHAQKIAARCAELLGV